ncbi:MAG: lysophospholipid acyltransferase family protein [Thermodesulfobacteriota bacterium]
MPAKKVPPSYHPRTWPTHLGLLLLRLLGLLPLPLIWLISYPLGLFLYALVGSRRRVTQRNLARCFPSLAKAQVNRLARRHFWHLCQNVLAAGITYFSGARRIRRLVRVRGEEHLTGAQARGENIIILAPHFLSLDICGVRLGIDHGGASMYQPIHNKVLNDQILAGRSRFGTAILPNTAALRPLLRLIKKGTPFYYLPDQSPSGQEGIFVPFFNIQTLTYPTLGRLTRLTKATVIPCRCRQLSLGRGYEVEFQPPLEHFHGDDEYNDTLRMNGVVEELIGPQPEHYMWIHRRFKIRPPGEPAFYE